MNNKTPHRYDPFANALAESVPASLLESQPGADDVALPATEESGSEAAKMVSENWIEPVHAKDPAQAALFPESLAQRLIAARDARGWKTADVASKLRLPLHVVQTIEAEQFDRIGHGIYLRGYLNHYARLVGVPAAAVDEVLQRHVAPLPELVSSGRVSHSRYLIDRYSGSALYVVLTGVIFVPLVMFAMNMGSDGAARLLPLDAPAAATATANTSVELPLAKPGDGAAGNTVVPATAAPAASVAPSSADTPLMASLTPVLRAQASEGAGTHAEPVSSAGAQTVKLSLAETSWVEIVDAEGKRLESGILPAGTIKSYASDKALDVRIGNTTGAKVEVNGSEQDIAPYNRGNVAHFKLSAAGKLLTRADAQ